MFIFSNTEHQGNKREYDKKCCCYKDEADSCLKACKACCQNSYICRKRHGKCSASCAGCQHRPKYHSAQKYRKKIISLLTVDHRRSDISGIISLYFPQKKIISLMILRIVIS